MSDDIRKLAPALAPATWRSTKIAINTWEQGTPPEAPAPTSCPKYTIWARLASTRSECYGDRTPARYPANIRAPRPTTPRCWRPGCHPPADEELNPETGRPRHVATTGSAAGRLHPRHRGGARRAHLGRQARPRRPAADPRTPLPARRGDSLGGRGR